MLFGNALYDYLMAVVLFVLFVLIFKGLQWAALRSVEGVIKRTETNWDDAVVTIIKTIRPPFYWYVAFYIALSYLKIEGVAARAVDLGLITWLVYQVVLALRILIDFYVQQRLSKSDKGAQAATQLVHSLVGVGLWLLGGLFLLQNFGINVTSLIAGLGIGGIAIALAAQNVLADLFSSLAIFFDKPFVPGDFIELNGNKGTVQKIGIKTTRIRALNGEEIIVPNREVTGVVIKNIGRRKERRVIFKIGIVYETITEKVRKVPDLIREVIEAQDKIEFDRVHLKELAESSLSFEIVYHVKSNDYQVYMDINQRVLLGIKEAFERNGIEIAYPTRMLYVNKP
jgi:small-conductance mechanosensitive channel